MADSDAEWVGVDFEFGNPARTPTTTTTRPRPRARPAVPATPAPRPALEPPHDAPEVAASGPAGGVSPGWVGGVVGGGLGVVLVVLVVYMVVLRRRLNKARAAGEASRFSLRVADVAHLSHLDHTENTYVNTTDLQRFVAAVRAKDKSAAGLPLPPRTATNSRPNSDSEVTVVRPPMPLPNTAQTSVYPVSPLTSPDSPTETEALYANLHENQDLGPLPSGKAPPPKIPPPPTSARRQSASGPTSPSVIARPAPPPPQPPTQTDPFPLQITSSPPQANQSVNKNSTPQVVKPAPPPVALKPNKPMQADTQSPVAKPSAPVKPSLPKPGVSKKGKALPPLKLVLTRNQDSNPTPDTALTTLTPDTASSTSSVTAKVAFLEGKVSLAPRSFPPKTTS
ncbi:hypothetical protein Pmani_014617 [Petrolisthes manimaculis]|uniref:Uncharacterized protein n=1 Tax=Petrolisthes manimaculis TaxID=1843537 RepID=A0AAE1U8I9_9EUCA|nr:hypothetical protein Pmani_023297 [Petrolisthes manimaculis]KAK4314087.1 hypothetical protein Pmani_014617 [Petrolisthes manimaculis]